MPIDLNIIALQIGERIREKGTMQGRIPFLTGDLRKSIAVSLVGPGAVAIGSNLSYARAVHDGRRAIVIRPKNQKTFFRRVKKKVKGFFGIETKGPSVLSWIGPDGIRHFATHVHQPARKGKPFLREAIEEVQREGYDFLMPELNRQVSAELASAFVGKINIDVKL